MLDPNDKPQALIRQLPAPLRADLARFLAESTATAAQEPRIRASLSLAATLRAKRQRAPD